MRVSSMSAKHLPQDEQFLGHRRRHRAKEADRRSARDRGGKRMQTGMAGRKTSHTICSITLEEKLQGGRAQCHVSSLNWNEFHSLISKVNAKA
jgi:hypothetical protein